MGSVDDPTRANSIKSDIDRRFASLPLAYRKNDPDARWDEKHVCVPSASPTSGSRIYDDALLTKTFDGQGEEPDMALCKTAVDIDIPLIDLSHQLFEHVYLINAKFHLATFLVFDTAAFLCSAMIYDKNRSLPQRETIIQNIGLARSLMQKLAQVTKTGAICYPALVRLAKSVSTSSGRTAHFAGVSGNISDLGSNGTDTSPEIELDEIPPSDVAFAESLPLALGQVAPNDIFLPTSLAIQYQVGKHTMSLAWAIKL